VNVANLSADEKLLLQQFDTEEHLTTSSTQSGGVVLSWSPRTHGPDPVPCSKNRWSGVCANKTMTKVLGTLFRKYFR
jgi:hypothetical protein